MFRCFLYYLFAEICISFDIVSFYLPLGYINIIMYRISSQLQRCVGHVNVEYQI